MRKKLLLVFLMVLSVFLPAGSTSALTTTELYNNAANNIFFYVKGDDACNPSTLAEYVATVTGDQITWIGDAWSVFARLAIETRYPGVSIFAEKSRNFSETTAIESGLDVAKRLADNNALRKYVVFMVGTNGGANKTEEEAKTMISELISAVGEDRTIVLMTLRTRTREYENFNNALKSLASSNEKILVAEWEEAVKDKIDEYFEEGKDSLNEKGYNMLVATVAGALDKYTNDLKSKATSTVGASAPALGGESISIDGTREERAIYIALRLRGAGYDGDTIAAILGNLEGESGGLNPNNVEKKTGYGGSVDASWRIDNWSGLDKTGFGIVQWTSKGRQLALQKFADENGLPITGLEAQTGFMLQELTTGSRTAKTKVDNIRGKGIELATFIIYRDYETPASSYQVKCNKGLCNTYDPTTLDKLSSSSTAWAYSAYSNRLKYAKSYLSLIEANGIEHGSGIVWQGGGGAGGGSSGALCSTNAQGATGLAMLARQMSWPNDNGTCLTNTGAVRQWRDKACYPNPRDKYKQVVEELRTKGINIPKFMDCSYFIAAVIRYSGLDDNWPAPGGSEPAWRYANSEKGQQLWAKIENLGNTSNLMPGDVFTYPRANGRAGHVMMYIGEYGGRFGNMAGASLDNNVAMVGKIYFTHADNGSGAGTRFTISRYKGSAMAELGTNTGEELSGEFEEDEGVTETVSVNNSCGAAKVSTGKVYEGVTKSSSVVTTLGRAVNMISGDNTAHTRAFGSYLLIQYEREAGASASESGLSSWLTKKYGASVTGYTRSSSDPSDATKTVLAYLMTSGTRTLPASTYEMLAPSGATWIKLDGTNTTKVKGSLAGKSDLDKLTSGTSTGVVKGYDKDLEFYCAVKDSSGNYSKLFWQYRKTPSGQETK